jgi:CRISPR-associated protein Cas2
MLVAITYDVADDARRSRIATILEGYGSRVQESVFEADLEPRDLEQLLTDLETCLDTTKDRLRVYRFCEACAKRVLAKGGPAIERAAGYYIV